MSQPLRKCPNCGAEVLPSAVYCGHCGQPMNREPSGPWDAFLKVLAVILLVVVACPLGAFGGCAVLLGATGGSEGLQFAAFGLLGLAVAGGLVYFTIWAFRKR